MAETTIVYSVDRKSVTSQRARMTMESARGREVWLWKAWFQHKTDILLKDIDTDIDTLISLESWPQLMSKVWFLLKHNYVSAFFPVSKCWPDKHSKSDHDMFVTDKGCDLKWMKCKSRLFHKHVQYTNNSFLYVI